MTAFRRLSIAEQISQALREGIHSGRWIRELPGVGRLAADLEVSKVTMRAALRMLEEEGLIAPAGQRGCRVISLDHEESQGDVPRLKMGFLPIRPANEWLPSDHATFERIWKGIKAAGHTCLVESKSQEELHHDLARIERRVQAARADAWIVVQGRRATLEWFQTLPTPTLALGGSKLPGMAHVGRDLNLVIRKAIEEFVARGHQRIIFIVSPRFQLPNSSIPGGMLAALRAHGIPASANYNIPVWEDSPAGLRELLDELFRVTPPTALFLQNFKSLLPTLAFLAERGIRVPGQVSIICGDCEPSIPWTADVIAHMQPDNEWAFRHISRWVTSVARGRPNISHFFAPFRFVPTRSIGLAPTSHHGI